MIGTVLFDNQNIFNLADPEDDTRLFRLADELHVRTRAGVVRGQLLFKPGDRYSRRLLDESERILRADGYLYDASIRAVAYRGNIVDVEVTTRDVWTLNPGFNFGRSGGTNSTGVQLEDTNVVGSGASLKVSHSRNVDRSSSQLEVDDEHLLDGWVSLHAAYGDMSDGRLRELTVQRPMYSLETRWAGGGYALSDLQDDSLWDRGNVIDRFQDRHQGAQLFAGWSSGLENGWVRRWSSGVTYDEHRFAPAASWDGSVLLPADRRFLYPWLQFDLLQDDYLKLWNHDQIGRTEDFYLGTAASARVGFAGSAFGSSASAMLLQSSVSRGFRGTWSTLLLYGDFSGRVTARRLYNGLADLTARYYVEQS
ncbi:MAG: hypothetical protein JO361_03835, partial [Gammaproteobacteria bacterium]|nr:hypothetical protein [Gammaproteobacteria bacterium]